MAEAGGLRAYHRVRAWRARWALPPLAARALIPSEEPELIYEWNPGWSRGDFTVNSFDMPNEEITLAKPPGVFCIALVGDSISAGFELRPRPELYLYVLDRTLDHEARDGWRFEALNFAVTGSLERS